MGWFATISAALIAVATAAFSSGPAAASSRESTRLVAGWRFIKQDVAGAERPDFDDSKWSNITLPHTFNASDGDDGTYYRGPAWYRRSIDMAKKRPGRRLAIHFDAVATAADVFVNGKKIGRHEGPHAAFRFDITDAVVPGRNLIAVRVDSSPTKVISPLGGDFTIFGGLYRPVSIIETDALHLDLYHFAGPGIRAQASDIGPRSATVSIQARVANDLARPTRTRVQSRVLNADGREVARTSRSLSIQPRSVVTAQLTTRIREPRLWDGIRDPYLYRIVTTVGDDGDQVTVPLGIRTFRFDAQQGFILNGKPYPLNGANLHLPARPGKGGAVSDDEVAEDFAILRDMGSTGLRLAHFQHPTKSYAEADRLGLGLWTEIGINSEVQETPAFKANSAQQLRELIEQTYNHPSIFMWGIGNEVYSEDPSVARVLQYLQGVAKEADPSRPTVYAHCCQLDDHPKALVTDIIGFNRYYGWYPDNQGRTMHSWADGFHQLFPDRPFSVSEYGAGGSVFHQEDPPGPVETTAPWHPEQYQTQYHERNWLELRDKPYIYAKFVWVAFDFASAGRHEGDRRGINDKGLVTHDRKVKKDSYFWYQANWSGKPMLHITSRRHTDRRTPEVEVKAYTNAGPATLFLNGVAAGPAEPQDRILRWKVRLRPGPNSIEVRSAGAILMDRVTWSHLPLPSMLSNDGNRK